MGVLQAEKQVIGGSFHVGRTRFRATFDCPQTLSPVLTLQPSQQAPHLPLLWVGERAPKNIAWGRLRRRGVGWYILPNLANEDKRQVGLDSLRTPV